MRRGQGAGGRAATGRGRLAVRRGWRGHTAVFAIADVKWEFLPFILVWNCSGPTDWVGNGWRGGSMVTVSHNTAAGAGLWVTGILSPRSIPIDVESSLWRNCSSHTFSDARWNLCRTHNKALSSIPWSCVVAAEDLWSQRYYGGWRCWFVGSLWVVEMIDQGCLDYGSCCCNPLFSSYRWTYSYKINANY